MKYVLVFEDERIKDSDYKKFIEIPSSLNTEKNLISFYRKELNFPEYFGSNSNWDAFYDILSDLYWLDVKEVVVYHDSLPQLNKDDLLIYIEIIRDLLKNSDETGRILKFVFNIKDKEEIQSLLK